MIKAYLKYLSHAINEHKIHSPFVFDFYNEVVKKTEDVDDAFIQMVRSELENEDRKIQITDLGQGSKKHKGNSRKISDLAAMQGVSRKYGRLLSRIVEHYELKDCLELGTSLGFGTAHIARYANSVVTIEGCPAIQAEAINNFNDYEGVNIKFVLGEFSEVLPDTIANVERLDLAYIDGNHGYEPTMEYFEMILEKAHNDTFIIFDDINWSEGMRKAWGEICQSDEINVSIELFRMGIVLKRKEQAKEHFVLKF